MELSEVMAITETGVLIYKGSNGDYYEIVGGKDGVINLSKYP